jgi:dihydrodipicolinate synthase/N-acetylneuraminate lyase
MLTPDEITGVLALPPTPRLGADTRWDESCSVDLNESARMTEVLIGDGVGSIALCGTTGECASLLWEEKVAYFRTAIEAAAGRVPMWCGATAFGTREVVRQMRVARDLGATGVLVGPPIWQTPTLANVTRFFADLSEAVPDLPVMVYANSFMFKYDFPREFWRAVLGSAPTLVAAKMVDPSDELRELTAGRINLLSGEVRGVSHRFRTDPDSLTALWATSAAMGPEPWVTLISSQQCGDAARALTAMEDLESVPLAIPNRDDFPKYNIQFESLRIARAGYIRCGPPRAPYYDLPPEWADAAEANAKAWVAMLDRRRAGT